MDRGGRGRDVYRDRTVFTYLAHLLKAQSNVVCTYLYEERGHGEGGEVCVRVCAVEEDMDKCQARARGDFAKRKF